MPDDQGPNMEMRAFLAVVLSLAVMMFYQYFLAPPPPVPPSVPPSGEVVEPPVAGPTIPRSQPGEGTAAEPGGDQPETRDPLVEPVAATREASWLLQTDLYRMTISNRGARITSFILEDYESDFGGPLELIVHEPGFEPLGMLNLATPEIPELAVAANDALYVVTIDGREPASSVHRVEGATEIRWSWNDGAGWSVDKRLTIDRSSYLSMLETSVATPVETPTLITLGPGLEEDADVTRTGIYLMKGAVLFDGSVEHIPDTDLETPEEPRVQSILWGGIQSNYFLAAMVPAGAASIQLSAAPAPAVGAAVASEGAEGSEPADGAAQPGTRARFGLAIPAGGTLQLPMYVGPKSYEALQTAGYELHRAVDYGMFAILARPVAVGLEYLNDLIGNYGLAIILATLVVRLAFFPLAQSSMKSMRRMQQLQPQMNAIRAKYKGVKDVQKRQEMNAEVMKLYKDHGVSPLGGCLPMLLQMPVLFGFYAAISVSIDIRQAPFILWIDDLSKMDPYYILPLLMGASMYAQQRMSPGTGDPMQQKIFRLMPVMFTFFFLSFPSGLVIYWLVNTLLGIAQQAYVNHQLDAPDAKTTPSPAKKKKGQSGGGAKRKKRGKR
jgi:YidC/Oxa1 family membrane protein insertase